MKKALLLMASLALLWTATAVQADSFLVLGRAPMTGSEAEVRQKAVADALYRGVSQRACTLERRASRLSTAFLARPRM